MVNVADTGRMAGEDKMQRLLKHAHQEAARWMRTFGKELPAAKAAELMGSVSSIMGAIYKELPPKYRPRLEGHMRWVEVYARLLESGKVRAYGKLSKEQRAAVEAELLEALAGLEKMLADMGVYVQDAMREARIEAQLEGEMTADEYLEEQARKAAAESVPALFTMEMYKARTGSEKFAPDARGKEPVLSVNVHAVLADGSKSTKNDLIADENGSVLWGRLPELDALKDKGYAGLNLLLRLGYKNEGFNLLSI